MLKLNRKGYLTIEIILASVIAFAIAFFLIEITMKLVDKTDNYYVDTIFMTDKALVTKNLKALIENDINEYGKITSISCSSNNDCTIVFGDETNGETQKNLTVDSDNNINYADGKYTKKFDTKLSGDVTMGGSVNDSYAYIYIKFKNIFEGNNYDVIIPIANIKKADENILKNYAVYLDIKGYYGGQSTTVKFDNSTGLYSYDVYENYDQLFKSSTSDADLTCYTNEEMTIEYDYYGLRTMEFQFLRIDFYPDYDMPTKLYCKLEERY